MCEPGTFIYQGFGFNGFNFFDPKGLALYAFDGTWNNPADNTNVWILQQAYLGDVLYQRGVGSNPMIRGNILVGGLTGLGTRARVNAAYRRFKENWKRGDREIDIIGFSRGAAAAREFAWKISSYRVRDNDGFAVRPTIRFLGLFDTVYSIGLPGNDIDLGYENRLPENIEHIRHAIATGERRLGFELTSIKPSKGYRPHIGTRVEKEFPGAHSDVGGGYSDNRTAANRVLLWMWTEARDLDVPFGDLPEEFLPKPDDQLMYHDSREDDELVRIDELNERNENKTRKVYRPTY